MIFVFHVRERKGRGERGGDPSFTSASVFNNKVNFLDFTHTGELLLFG